MTLASNLNKDKIALLMDPMVLVKLQVSDVLENYGLFLEVILNALEEDNYSLFLRQHIFLKEIFEIKLFIQIPNLKC